MPHLPNEIWLLVASYCSPQDLWLSIRPVNQQLQQCAEQYFKYEILPHTTLVLPVVIPTYDVRTPVRGKVVFNPMPQTCDTDVVGNFDNAIYCMKATEPDYYLPHFLSRWATMQHPETAHLDERRVKWELELEGWRHPVSLRRPMALKHGCKDGEARVLFDWRYMMTAFFMCSRSLTEAWRGSG